jgi:hypothetical protein
VRFRSWPRFVALSLVAFAAIDAGALIAGGSSCTSTTTVNAALINGIQINSDELFGGVGNNSNPPCGKEADDVYKYVAVVIDDKKDIAGAGIFDCFASAVFANLPGTDAGSLNFAVWVYAYNLTDFDNANAKGVLTNAVALLNGVIQPDGSIIPVPTDLVPDGGTTKAGYPAALSRLCLQHATWVTTCTAASQPGLDVSASCKTMVAESGSQSSCNLPVSLPDASHD